MPRDGTLIPSHRPGALAAAVQLRPLVVPAALAEPVATLMREGPGAAPTEGYPVALRQEAAFAAQVFAAALQPAGPEMTRNLARPWLLLLLRAVRYAPNRDDFEAFLDATVDVCADLPAMAWCKETSVAAMSRFSTWPAVAEVASLLRNHVARNRCHLQAIERIAKEPPARPDPGPMMPAGKAVAALRDLRQAIQAPREPGPSGAVLPSRDHERRPVAKPVPSSMIQAFRASSPLVQAAKAERGQG